ncbi:sugar phosphate isomerase/epimerase family protein [Streptomyces sp. Z26]|uniref:sugar phosphate isomerase/epimerase family protein n=1 Tax=Streptomyces TaxID=1883 RepID=UPI000EF168DC|nr:sugar phosphate isomerase/epimerase family protein [Streptomyces sp. Z26]RLL66937.1 sugar phosphate isomerase/epimerase [Streptomyces sp. Z26]
MRLAFSTLGVPGMSIPEVARLASENGFHGVELRAHPEEPVHPGLSLNERVELVEEFKAADVSILTVAGYAKVAAPGDDEPVLAEIRALLELARDIGARYVRVFPGGGEGSTARADARAVRRLSAAAALAAGMGPRVLLETHDSHPTGGDVARLLDSVGVGPVGALWDVMHTWRGEEDPAESLRHLAPHLGYVQVKDIAAAEKTAPLPPGAGVLPLAEVVELLSRSGWDGWLCWEYEKRWYPEAPELPALLPSVREHLLRLLAAAA